MVSNLMNVPGGVSSALMLLVAIGLAGSALAEQEAASPVVVGAVDVATDYVSSRVGAEIYDRDFRQVGWRDLKHIKNLRRQTAVKFMFEPPASPWVEVEFEVYVGEGGTCSVQPEWVIPVCAAEPERCAVRITPSDAVSIAENYGWEHGEAEWRVEVRTLERFEGFVCVVSRRSGPSTLARLVINAFSGDVIEEHFVTSID